jgi:putative salt-induced outer membrane protein YdiY
MAGQLAILGNRSQRGPTKNCTDRIPMSRQHFGSLAVTVILLGLFPLTSNATKTDVVILVNGNAVTGEVKNLEFGSLRYSTDSMGTVNIDWEDIVSVTSQQDLQIELSDGTRYFGKLFPGDDSFFVRIVTASKDLVIESSRIVRITPIETSKKFLERLDGSFILGIQTQKSSEVTTSNLAADVSYRTREYLFGTRLNSSITDQPSEPTKARQSLGFNYQRFRQNRWFTDWFTGLERNDELGIAARTSAGVALGRYITQTNKNQLSLAVGVQGARTNYIGDDESATEAEGRIEIRYLRRRLAPETSFRFTSTIYPLLEDASRYRAESNLSLRREVYEDLFLELGIGYSYISHPPTGAEKLDYTATTSIGYSF